MNVLFWKNVFLCRVDALGNALEHRYGVINVFCFTVSFDLVFVDNGLKSKELSIIGNRQYVCQ